MSKTQDFLFEFSRRSYEREEQGNDAILRTLPFFATSLGALLAGLAVMGGRIESLPPSREPVAYVLLGLVLILALAAIVCIGVAVVFTRSARLLAASVRVVERAQQLSARHAAAHAGATDAAIDTMVLFDLRDSLIQEMSIAADENRLANVSRMRWLKSAIAALTLSLIVAFVTMFGLYGQAVMQGSIMGHTKPTSSDIEAPGRETDQDLSAELPPLGSWDLRQWGLSYHLVPHVDTAEDAALRKRASYRPVRRQV